MTRNNNSNNGSLARLGAFLMTSAVVLFQLKGSSRATLQPYLSMASSDIPSLFRSHNTDNNQHILEQQNQASRRADLIADSIQMAELLKTQAVDQLPQTDTDASSTQTPPIKLPKKPLNILILYPDDWRHDSIGGVAPVVKTPFLNQLARDGIRFTYNMVTTSICWVSRATLFTGQYVSRHKSYKLRTPVFYESWHNTSWPALLQQHTIPYFTGHIGKWQYANPNRIVQTQLFNYTSIFEGKHTYVEPGGTVISAAEKTYREVKTFLEQRPKDQAFAVTAAFYPPKAIGNSFVPGGQWFPQNRTRELHYPANETVPRPYNETDAYQRLPWFFHKLERGGRSRWEERFQTEEQYQAAMKNYYSLVTEVDAACRDIVGELEQQGILDETLIIFTTDNGMFLGEHGLAGKWYPYQESIRVPLIIRDPRMPLHKRNTLDDSLTLNVDLQATILGGAGIAPPPTSQGRNMADLYLPPATRNSEPAISEEPWRTDFLYEFPLDMGKTMPMSTAVVRKDLKYIRWPQFHYTQLFNLTEDPLELNDVRQDPQYADVVQELAARHLELAAAIK